MQRNNPRYPIYIVSKGRAESRFTSKALEKTQVPYRIVIEEQEFDQYAAVIDPAKILILDPVYQRDYDVFDDLGDSKPKGSGPARNFVWDHAQASGVERHWTVDDNIRCFLRLNHNLRVPVGDGTIFACMEDFADRYTNVAMAGPNYRKFVPRKVKKPPFTLNTRIYSCNLIQTDLPFRWRGRFNEDTDLSLRMLKAGWSTVLFNAFLQFKLETMQMKGGNTDTIYVDGTLPKSQQLAEMHPNEARIGWRFHRWHHYVDYSRFKKNKLIRRADIQIPTGVDDYGMKLRKVA